MSSREGGFVPIKSYLICTQARTGSSLLCSGLRESGLAGNPKEHFHRSKLPSIKASCQQSILDTGPGTNPLSRFLLEHTGTNGVFGTKFMPHYIEHVRSAVGDLVDTQGRSDFDLLNYLLADPQYVYLWRRDKLRQAISLCRARQSQVWGLQSTDDKQDKLSKHKAVEFDYWQIRTFIKRIEARDSDWELFFEKHHIHPLRICYEEMISDYEQAVLCVLNYVGITSSAATANDNPKLEKQSDEITDEWVARYQLMDRENSGSWRTRFIDRIGAVIRARKFP